MVPTPRPPCHPERSEGPRLRSFRCHVTQKCARQPIVSREAPGKDGASRLRVRSFAALRMTRSKGCLLLWARKFMGEKALHFPRSRAGFLNPTTIIPLTECHSSLPLQAGSARVAHVGRLLPGKTLPERDFVKFFTNCLRDRCGKRKWRGQIAPGCRVRQCFVAYLIDSLIV